MQEAASKRIVAGVAAQTELQELAAGSETVSIAKRHPSQAVISHAPAAGGYVEGLPRRAPRITVQPVADKCLTISGLSVLWSPRGERTKGLKC